MVTYGSYLDENENMLKGCVPVVFMDTIVSILAAIAVFTIVFSADLEPGSGPGLLFKTLPWVFSQLPAGYLLAVMFFLLVLLAAVTSEISAMEPTIAYLQDEWGVNRHRAVITCGAGAFILGVPSALSYSLLKNTTIFGETFLDFVSFAASNMLIPLGGFLAVILVGWRWGTTNALDEIKKGSEGFIDRNPWLVQYFRLSFKYTAPVLILIVFLHALGIFS